MKVLRKTFIEATLAVAHEVLKDTESLGIVFDGYGAGSFMTAAKIKGMIVAELSDERSAYMAREHNNARMITVGAKIVGTELAKNIIKRILNRSLCRRASSNTCRYVK